MRRVQKKKTPLHNLPAGYQSICTMYMQSIENDMYVMGVKVKKE